MADGLALTIALLVLAAALAAAVARPAWCPEWAAAGAGALLLVAIGAISAHDAWAAVRQLGPTVGFLAALLVLADGCRREGLFSALGALMARGARDEPRRLLALVFAVASTVTAVLSLDATVVLLTPVVFATAARVRTSPRPHVFACSHLANSASLLLPVSNLTNLLAFHSSGLSFTRFAGLMGLPTLGVIAVEWLVLQRFFAVDLGRPRARRDVDAGAPPHLPRHALVVVALTLAGFGASSAIGIEPVWVAAAGAVAMLARRPPSPREVVAAAEPGFLVFVLGLGVIVAAASDRGLASAVEHLLPGGESLTALLAIAAIAAILANLVNNLPAILVLLPVTAASGPAAVLAALIGVNVGPNLTYVGSLATLLWRRVLHAEDTDVELGEFVRLGALTVPAGLVVCTTLLWLAARGLL
ncbi:MAG: SLC13 family permease [Solirubrobacteraceae bacterium]